MTSPTDVQTKTAPEKVTFWQAFRFWLKLGFISFGGPAGQISIMHQELVENRLWISEHRFLHALNFTMLLPGPEAQQLATYIGWLLHGTAGGIVAGVLFILPSLFILMGLSWIYLEFQNAPLVTGILYGIKPAVTAIVLFAAIRIGRRAITSLPLLSLSVLAFLAIFFLKAPFPLIILTAAIAGYCGGRMAPDKFTNTSPHVSNINTYGPALIDDHSPLPAHTRFTWRRTIRYAVIGLLIWMVSMMVLVLLDDWQGMLTQMGWFFTKAALLTFGGAYAVLPYVYQGAVEHYGWLTAPQMIDGLALGETTPGPLIMIVTFVGFLGGWSGGFPWTTLQPLGGIVAACVTTFFTFLPSFVFILVGGPIVEATRGEPGFTAPLTGITAAVVGVIVNLALTFSGHVFWPAGFTGAIEWAALLIAAGAFIALYFFRRGIVSVITACAIAGLVVSMLNHFNFLM
ncbi:MAG: chromate efflux transporter [Gammaproteobacteria bacterium]